MANNKRNKHRVQLNKYGWPLFTASQTENRIALCKEALCPTRELIIRFKNCYENDLSIQRRARLTATSRQEFSEILAEINERGWGGEYCTYKQALEGAFYPFVRCSGRKPVDTGAIWIGTRYDYPLIFVDNSVANWVCPYTKSGKVMSEPFEPYARVVQNWGRLSNRKLYPSLNLQPVPS